MGIFKNASAPVVKNARAAARRGGDGGYVVALAGNPNVGKSTVFNALTGMKQHTGNWPGKTVGTAEGAHTLRGETYTLVDLPGCYSLMAHSQEEEVARDFLLFGGADAAIVVCDATCLERNLNLALQTMEIMQNVILCVNLMDEAEKKGVHIDLAALERSLGVPVVGASARAGEGLPELMEKVRAICHGEIRPAPRRVRYAAPIEQAVAHMLPLLQEQDVRALNPRFLALRLLDPDPALLLGVERHLGVDLAKLPDVREGVEEAGAALAAGGIAREALRDRMVRCIVLSAEEIAGRAVSRPRGNDLRDRKLDRILTSRKTGIPIMLALLAFIFWLTITGANYPSALLAEGLFYVQDRLSDLFALLHAPDWMHGMLVLGVYRVLAWVISVMLPPMAIFFPLFTLLEDFGYLPRVAFNLDHRFKKAKACGKQALTMCMGFGCNAAGVTGCRIIDSPRERLIAIITNNFVPCNGRFPTLIAIITMFFVGGAAGMFDTLLSSVLLLCVILIGVFLTLGVSRFLSETILKGEPSSFTLELPPFRAPQVGRVIVRSLLDRTLFVLGRAVVIAAPAGLLIWVLANVHSDGISLLAHCSNFLDPFGRLLGMDGVILLAFILGFPANEIVVPIIVMAYLSTGTIQEMGSIWELKALLTANGWTWITALSTMLFCLIHWPCSTTCLTIGKETRSLKWTAISFALPTLIGMVVCFLFATVARLLV